MSSELACSNLSKIAYKNEPASDERIWSSGQEDCELNISCITVKSLYHSHGAALWCGIAGYDSEIAQRRDFIAFNLESIICGLLFRSFSHRVISTWSLLHHNMLSLLHSQFKQSYGPCLLNRTENTPRVPQRLLCPSPQDCKLALERLSCDSSMLLMSNLSHNSTYTKSNPFVKQPDRLGSLNSRHDWANRNQGSLNTGTKFRQDATISVLCSGYKHSRHFKFVTGADILKLCLEQEKTLPHCGSQSKNAFLECERSL